MDYKWPEDLKLDPGARTALEKVTEKVPLLAEWPEDEKMREADQPRAMADVLIPAFHPEIQNAKIAYLFVQTMGSRNRTVAAKTALLSRKVKFLSEFDFCITFNWTIWKGLNPAQRAALVDHELEHCGVADDGRYISLSHDLEEFNAIVRRWGLWQEGLHQFVEAARPQLELEIPASK